MKMIKQVEIIDWDKINWIFTIAEGCQIIH